MKNDRRHFKMSREPLARSDTGSESVKQLTCHYEQRHGLPMRSNPKVLRKDCFDKKRLAMTEWRDLPAGYLTGSSSPPGKPPTGFSEPDVGGLAHRLFGRPPDAECDVDRTMDERMLSELETTWLTDKEIRHGCCVVLKQVLLRYKKLLAFGEKECPNKNSAQQSMEIRNSSRSSIIAIQMARSKLSESDRSECINVNRLRLEIGGSYSKILEYGSPAAINSAGLEASRRIGNWRRSVLPVPLYAVFLADWNSVIVESVRLVLQRWRGVCSFSQTMRSTGAMKEVIWCMTFAPKNEVGLPARHLSGGENDLLRSCSKALKYDDISIT